MELVRQLAGNFQWHFQLERYSISVSSHAEQPVTEASVKLRIGDEVFLATGTRVFNGAHLGDRSEVRVNATVHLRTNLPEDTVVPIGWVAVGDPATLYSPDQHEEIWAAQRELDFLGYVFGIDRSTPDLMVQLTERYGRSLARHARDEQVGD